MTMSGEVIIEALDALVEELDRERLYWETPEDHGFSQPFCEGVAGGISRALLQLRGLTDWAKGNTRVERVREMMTGLEQAMAALKDKQCGVYCWIPPKTSASRRSLRLARLRAVEIDRKRAEVE